MTVYVGIDPGLDGYLAAVYPDGQVDFHPSPLLEDSGKGRRRYDRGGFLRLAEALVDKARLVHADDLLAVIERQQAMGRGSTGTAFTTGLGYGYWTMALEAAFVPFVEVRPADWKRDLRIRGTGSDAAARKKDSKRKACELAASLYPTAELVPPRCRVPNADRAEALLLAEVAKRMRAPAGGA